MRGFKYTYLCTDAVTAPILHMKTNEVHNLLGGGGILIYLYVCRMPFSYYDPKKITVEVALTAVHFYYNKIGAFILKKKKKKKN
jgi:hypothetical protein